MQSIRKSFKSYGSYNKILKGFPAMKTHPQLQPRVSPNPPRPKNPPPQCGDRWRQPPLWHLDFT